MEKAGFFSGKKKIIIIAAAVVLLLGTFIYFKYFLNFNGVSTELVLRGTKEVTATMNFFVVRDEEYLSSNSSEQAIPLVSNGDRVAERDKIAVVCKSEKDASAYSEMLEVEADIEYYKQLSSMSNVNTVKLESVKLQIRSAFADLLDIADSGKLSDFDKGVKAYADKKTRQDIAINGRMDFSQQISQLTERLAALKGSMSNIQEVYAETSGFFMGNTDGLENALQYNDVMNVTVEKIEAAIKAQPEQNGKPMGRLIKNHKWYLCAVMDKKSAAELTEGGSYKLILPESGLGRLTLKVESVKIPQGGEKAAVVMSGLETSENILNLRKGEARIVMKTYTGYKIPQAAVRTEKVEDKDVKFVYILNKTTVKRKDITILHSEADYVLVKISTDKLNAKEVQIYDKVITAGKDLRDGKIIY